MNHLFIGLHDMDNNLMYIESWMALGSMRYNIEDYFKGLSNNDHYAIYDGFDRLNQRILNFLVIPVVCAWACLKARPLSPVMLRKPRGSPFSSRAGDCLFFIPALSAQFLRSRNWKI